MAFTKFRTATAAMIIACALAQAPSASGANKQLRDYVQRAVACEKVGDTSAAEAFFAKAKDLEHYPLAAYVDRAVIRFENGDRKGAFDDINHAVENRSNDPKALRIRAHFEAQIGDNDGALRDYAESLKCGSQSSITYMGRGILYLSMDNSRSAFEDFERALALDPKNLLARFHRMCLTENKAQALADYRIITDTTPVDVQDHVIIGNTYVQFEETEKGANEFSKAISLQPNYAQAYYNRAVLRDQKGDKLGALADYDQAIEANSGYVKAYFNRGLLKFSLDDYDGGMNDMKRAVELDPELGKRRQDKPFEVLTS